MRAAAALALIAAVSACSKPAEPDQQTVPQAKPGCCSPTHTAPSPAPSPAPTGEPVSTSRDPRLVLVAWAKAMSLKDWDTAWRYWGDKGAASGESLEQFRARWGKLKDPQFDIFEGQGEGAAGSLFYTAPIVLIDGQRRVKGTIVLRRVNDVPGASEEQLRWHIERLELEP